jgi:stress response protein YsnF
MVSVDQARQLLGMQVVDTAGDKVGTVNEVYLNDQTDQLSWVTVATGWFGLSESFLPLKGARIDANRIRVPFDKATIKNAPRYQSGVPLTLQDEDELYRHYNIPVDSFAGRSTTENDAGAIGYPQATERGREAATGPNTDQALIRSADQLKTERRTGRARLRKYVITEQQTVVVPVSHEEARLEREPITDQGRNQELPGVQITEEEREIVLHAERPVVTTESVPVERVRLDRTPTAVAGEETVAGRVRNDQFGFADDTA